MWMPKQTRGLAINNDNYKQNSHVFAFSHQKESSLTLSTSPEIDTTLLLKILLLRFFHITQLQASKINIRVDRKHLELPPNWPNCKE